MPIILQSNALVNFVQGSYITDIQIVLESHELYDSLPGRMVAEGVKALSTYPYFITVVWNNNQQSSASYTTRDNPPGWKIREEPGAQFPIFDMTTTAKPTGVKARKRRVEKTLSEIRRLHDELNAQLYAQPTERPTIHNPADAFDILQPFLGPLQHEELWVMNLDTRNRVMGLVKLYQGSVNQSQVRVGEIFRQAVIDNAPSIVLAHNHPSGDPTPSPDDVAVTRAIVQAGKLLDISVLDHLVVTQGRYVSLKERGLGFGG